MEQKVCFLVCPIGDEESETRRNSDKLLHHVVQPVVESKGYTVVRADKILETDIITDTIMRYLENAELIIADLSEKNPNVYYELGYRAALKKPLIQLIRAGEKLPFDLSVTRTFDYDLSDPDKIEKIKSTLCNLVDNIETRQAELAVVAHSTDNFGAEMGQVIAAGMLKDMIENPQNSSKYVELFNNLGKMKRAIDDIQSN